MKRARDEPVPQAARRPQPVAQPATAASQKLTTSDALSYLREVKNRFADRKQVYDTFLDIMKEFKAQRIDTSGVIMRVKKLFKGHRELILGFNTFLPKGYEIELARVSDDEEEEEVMAQVQQPQQPAKQAVEFDQAISYVNKIKNRFANDERVYKAFLEILNMYRKGQKNINMVYSEVAVLFQHHDDLLHEFTYFLPDTSQHGTASAHIRAYMRGGGATYGGGYAGPAGAGGRMPGGPAGGMPGGYPRGGMVVGGPRGYPPGAAGGGMGPGGGLAHHLDTSRMHKRKAARRAEEGFRRMDEEDGGVYGGGSMVGRGFRGSLSREMQFLEKVKTRLRSRELYADFLKVLNMYCQEIIGRTELVHLVADILGRAPDLMAQFHQFVASCEAMEMGDGGMVGGMMGGRGMGAMPGVPPLSNRELLKAKLQKDKFMTKPLSEIVANETERITPSYVKMPPGYPRLTHSGRTPLGDAVLNDQYVNVITGSEDYSFKLMRKNQYEEALFRCEDDRYEFDIAFEQNASTLRMLRPVARRLAEMGPEERGAFSWADVPRLSAVHLAHVAKLYADSGPQLVDLLQKNPAVAIPVVVARLEAKDAEWRKVKEEMIPVWRKIYEQNYPRSLDHRSFYFKQAEKKCMMTKSMVAEVKEAADRRKGDEAYLRCLSMAHRHVIPATAAPVPDLAFAFADRVVFEDVYMALRTAVEHQLHPGAKEQVLLLVLQVIEPFFGLPVRAEELARLHEQAEEGGSKDADMEVADVKSDSSDAGGDDGKATPPPEETPEPGAMGAMEVDVQRREEDEGAGAASDEPERSFVQCKPLAPWVGPRPAPSEPADLQGAGQPVGPPPGTRVLFANENMYVFFRYHRYLYDRLCLARKICLEVATKKATQPVRGGGPLGVQAADADARAVTPEAPSEEAIKEDAERIHASFLGILRDVLSSGSVAGDGGAFEDQVRNLLGTNSYELFTLDKLLARLAKHLAGMVADEHTAALWEMYRYEACRGRQVPLAMYHLNCHTVLDDTCYRIEYSDADCTVRFQQNDAERSDSYLSPEGALPPYILAYINNTAGAGLPPLTPAALVGAEAAKRKAPLYLRRNLPPALLGSSSDGEAAGSSSSSGGPSADDQLLTALSQFLVLNGLETKVGCTSCKVSYVLDTEDVIVRRKRGVPQPQAYKTSGERSLLFSEWMARKSRSRDAAPKPSPEPHLAALALADALKANRAVAEGAAVADAASS